MNTMFNDVALLTADLVRIPSPYFQEAAVMDFAFHWLSERNLHPRKHEYFEKVITKVRGENVIGNIEGGEPGVKILLNAHLDTVNLCKGWKADPYAAIAQGNRLYGVGALDMKSGAAAMMVAVDAFHRDHPRFKGEILYTLVSDEEGPYGLGSRALIHDGLFGKPDLALIPEPSSGFSHRTFPCACLGARGGYNYTVRFSGKSAHAANPEEGISAIVDAAKVMIELKACEMKRDDKLGSGSVCLIESHGGGQACSVADEAAFTVFRHVVRGEDKAYLEEEMERAVRRAAIRSKYSIQFRENVFGQDTAFLPYTVDEGHPYTQKLLDRARRVTGKEPVIAYFASIGDFNTIASELNTPTFVFGSDGENYHSADEFVYLDSAAQTSEVIYGFLESLLL